MKTVPFLRTGLWLGLCLGLNLPAASLEEQVSALIPRLAAARVEDRYSAQMELLALAANASRPGAEAGRAAAAQLLAAKAADASTPQPARVWIVRQLENIGAAESVAALGALLGDRDAELRETARRALEKNSSPKASEPLRAALKAGGETVWQIGLINSLGERGDAEAAALIATKLKESPLAETAALALGKIGGDPAVTALGGALGRLEAAATGLILAGNKMLAQGLAAKAAAVFQQVFAANTSSTSRGAALVGLAKADPQKAQSLIAAVLTGNDQRLQFAAVNAAVEAHGKNFAAAMSPLLPQLAPPVKAQILRAFDAAGESALIAALGDADEGVRQAAIETLAKAGGAASVGPLLKIAAGATADRKAAETALGRIGGPGALAALEKQAAAGEAALRAAAITALGDQFATRSFAALLKYAAEPDAGVSKAALAVLKKAGTDQEIEGLTQLALRQQMAGAGDALQAVLNRAADKSAALKAVTAGAAGADAKGRQIMLEMLAGLGGPEAMAIVTKATGSADAGEREAAIRALAKWPDFAAATPLLQLAADASLKEPLHVAAIQGALRLADTSDAEPAQARLDVALAALKTARRPEDRRRVFAVMASVPDTKAFAALKPFINDPDFKNEAGAACLSLADSVRKSNRKLAREAAQTVRTANLSPALNSRAEALLQRIESNK